MNFLELIKELSILFPASSCHKSGNAFLYGACETEPYRAKHVVFSPMSQGMIDHLVQSYKQNVPDDLLTLYKTMNGGDLFWTTRTIKGTKLQIPVCMFSIYGIPFANSSGNLQPFNISLEDLNRPAHTPTNWLKFGAYYEPNNFSNKRDLFIDTDVGGVYSVDRGNCECYVLKEWESIDQCLCEVFAQLSLEYAQDWKDHCS